MGDYCGHDLSHLFTLRVPVGRRGEACVVIRAFEGAFDFRSSHSRIDVEVRHLGKVIFPLGALYCGVPAGTTIDGIEAKELVMSLVAMKPGDTDEDYFASYTKEQAAWAEAYGEEISMERERRYCDETGSVRRSS